MQTAKVQCGKWTNFNQLISISVCLPRKSLDFGGDAALDFGELLVATFEKIVIVYQLKQHIKGHFELHFSLKKFK